MDTDRNLLFGVMALQADVITQTQFVEACRHWAGGKQVSLADALLSGGRITPEDKAHIEYLMERKLAKYGGEARDALAEVWATWLTWTMSATDADPRRHLLELGDADIEKSLGLKASPALLSPPRPRPRIVPAALGVALLLVLLGVAVLSAWLWRAHEQARLQRDRAEQNFEAARSAVDDLVNQIGKQPLDGAGDLNARKRLLESALQYYQAFIEQQADDAGRRRELADAHRRVGEIHQELASKPEAEKSLWLAAELFEQLRQESPGDRAATIGLARAYLALARLQVLDGQSSAGSETVQKAIALLEPLHGADPSHAEYGRLLGQAYDLQGESHARLGEHAQALPFFRKAIATLEQAVQAAPAELQITRLLAEACNRAAASLERIGPESERAKLLRRAAVLFEQFVEKQPGDPGLRLDFVRVVSKLGVSQIRLGRFSAARKDLRKGLDLAQKAAEENPGASECRVLLAGFAALLGEAHLAQGQTAQAEPFFRQAVSIAEEFDRKEKTDVHESALAAHLNRLAALQAERGQVEDAVSLCERAIQIQERLVKRQPDPGTELELLFTRQRLLALRVAEDRDMRLEQLEDFLKAVRRQQELLEGPSAAADWRLVIGRSLTQLAKMQLGVGQPGTAVASVNQVIESLEAFHKEQPDHLAGQRLLAEALAERSRIKYRLGGAQDARKDARRAIELVEQLSYEEPAYRFDLARHRTLLAFTLGLGRQTADPEDGKEAERLALAAFRDLRQALRDGFDNQYRLESDEALQPLRDRPEWAKLLEP